MAKAELLWEMKAWQRIHRAAKIVANVRLGLNIAHPPEHPFSKKLQRAAVNLRSLMTELQERDL